MKKEDKQLEEQYLKMRDQNIKSNPWIEFKRIGDSMFSRSEIGKPLGPWEELKHWMEEQQEMFDGRHELLTSIYKDIEGAPKQEEDSLNFKMEQLDDAITACVENPEEHPLTKEHMELSSDIKKRIADIAEELYGQIEEL